MGELQEYVGAAVLQAHVDDGGRCATKPVERLISRVALGGKYSVSDSKVKQLGMTKYKKAGDGVYERTAGSGGPEVIHRKRS